MKRKFLTEGTGWFDEDKAIAFEGRYEWDGSNRISLATGSQWSHEKLWYTKSGRWVIEAWSAWVGSTDTVAEIGAGKAVDWLLRNEYDVEDLKEEYKLPEKVYKAVEELYNAKEV